MNITDEFGYWFSGLVDGGGHFGLLRNSRVGYYGFQFILKLRKDDKEVLEYVQNNLGFGYLYDLSPAGAKNEKPQVKFCMTSVLDCMKLVAVFDKYPLRSKNKKTIKYGEKQ